jgi:RNA polymerase sigma-70 factor (ECF subfamily)
VDTTAPGFETLAEDFVQEAILKILDKLDTFAGRSKFTTWAHKITVHEALTELRRKRWQDASLEQLTDRETGEYTPSITADDAPEPEQIVLRNDMLQRVNRIIEQNLTDRQRLAMQLAVVQEEPTVVVARALDTNPNAVYKLLHDARLRVKRQLAEEGLTPEDVLAIFE